MEGPREKSSLAPSSSERVVASDPDVPSVQPPASAPAGPSSPPPDGGFKAWATVVGGWCCLFVSFGWINCIGIFEAHYEHNQLSEYPPGIVAWITSTEVAVMYLTMPLHGKLYDNFGPKPLLYAGTLMHVFGLMMASLSTEYYQILLSQSICSAIGTSAVFSAAMGAVGSWFSKRRALALGVVASGSSLSACILP